MTETVERGWRPPQRVTVEEWLPIHGTGGDREPDYEWRKVATLERKGGATDMKPDAAEILRDADFR